MPTTVESFVYVHPTALCESQDMGEGTRVWAFAHVLDGAIVGEKCNIGDHAFIEGGARIGNRVTIKNGVMVWDGITIQDDAFVGPGVIFTNDRHPRSRRLAEAQSRYEQDENWLARTTVGRGASVGAGAIILPGITLGRFSMVAAGAVVTRDVPHYGIVIGHPATPCGWACACGISLDHDLRCSACQRPYRLQHDVLVSAE